MHTNDIKELYQTGRLRGNLRESDAERTLLLRDNVASGARRQDDNGRTVRAIILRIHKYEINTKEYQNAEY